MAPLKLAAKTTRYATICRSRKGIVSSGLLLMIAASHGAHQGGKSVMLSRAGLSILILAQFRQHRQILQRGRVARRRLAAGDVAQQPPHDLAGARLRQRFGEANLVGPSEGADLLDD